MAAESAVPPNALQARRGTLLGALLILFPVAVHAATLYANDFGAKPDGITLSTAAIQRAIDVAALRHDTVSFRPGTYLTGALFLKTGISFEIPAGVTLT